MKRNARYKGGSGTGVDLTVLLVDGQERRLHVDPGDELPTEVGGIAVDPDVVERLLEQEAEWELPETAAQRRKREQLERDVGEQNSAAEAAAADHLAAADKAMQDAEHTAAQHRAAGERAGDEAIERVKAEQALRGKGGQS